jgi:DNA (cytosine-5)-methyltransferase 1
VETIKAADLFCGAGGASEALRRACQEIERRLDLVAINHWPTAIQTHTLNHPGARHICAAVEAVDPRQAVPGGRLHLLTAGPECTHHSSARGGRPVNDQSRASAWHILRWLELLRVDNVLIENVPEFQTWGPLGVNGRPLKRRKGETYQAFLQALQSLGYRVDARVLNAADYGDPTTRKRLFIQARRGNRQITWPAPTHSRTGGATLFGRTERWRPARDVIDWSIPSKSIFGRKKPLSPKTMARIIAGLRRFGGKQLEPFLVCMEHQGSVRSLDQPLPTITTARGGAMAVVEPFLMHVTHGEDSGRTHSLEHPVPTVTGAHRGELALCEPFILQQQSGGAPRSVDQPLPAIATDGAQALIEPFLVAYHSEKPGEQPRVHGLDEPLGVVTTENRFGLVEPFVASYYGTKNLSPVSAPLPTVTTKDRFALVLPVVNGQVLDIRLRMLKPHELASAMSLGDGYKFAGNQGDQVKQIGNAWPRRLGQALIGELLKEYAPARAGQWTREAIA